ncbi:MULTISPECIES: glycosyltransferase [Aeribacillus]|uniref:Glycosyl transferase family 1 domain-containing protein n=2 Tax=Aeribacillus pallidus TaxID=33936 RepID=A0A165ZA55_9BACI|nr:MULTISPECIES: glycosyltransferase [Aeribacillus]KZN98036.1 hypothetical protein AZI98_00405 [Aeribacillus pallidus]MED1443376.1 glycosyltransferase [Aeribacillus composti]
MKRLKILLYGDQNLNIVDGSAIWLTSLANLLTIDDRVDLTILLKTPVKRKEVISNIKKKNNIVFINPYNRFSNWNFNDKHKMNVGDATNIIELLDNIENYDLIITRGKDLTAESLKKSFVKKQIPYITDFTHDETKIAEEEINFFREVYTTFPNIFVQTKEMGNYLKKLLNVSGEKFIELPPTVEDSLNPPKFELNNYSIVYAGKFAKEWMIEELINVYKQVKKYDPAITLNIAGDKFQGELIDKKDEIKQIFNDTEGIQWFGALSRRDSLNLIKDSDIGYAYRSEEIDNDNSLELSTKVLEYGINGKPVLLRRTKQYEKLLGSDYPLFANNEEELKNKIVLCFNDERIYQEAARKCYEASKAYQISLVSKKILSELWKYNNDKLTILFAGHDFKFLNWYIDWCKENKNINVLIDKWEGHNTHNIEQSEKYLREADIIFCEWGLGNSVFYSQNKLRGQKLFIRLHRQELDTNYLEEVNFCNVDKVIVITPYLFEEFNKKKRVPREKMIIIENMIDYKRFDKPKLDKIDKNLGIIGILPKLKRLDRALDIFEKLWIKDNEYKLFIKSKLPNELPWLMAREQERRYYEEVFNRIENSNWKENVIFDPHGNDVDEWLQKIKFILSTSDIEGSHVSPMEGMASGAIPIVFNWPGADTVYPEQFIVKSVDEAVDLIENYEEKVKNFDIKNFPRKYSRESRINAFNDLLFGDLN